MNFSPQQYRQSLVRELAWCLFSPSMVDRLPPIAPEPWLAGSDSAAEQILAHLDKNPEALARHLKAGGDRRLGARFEAMWTFFLEAHPGYDLLCSNWPVRVGDRTLGALDLLCLDRQLDAVVHCEIAVKFFLYDRNWPGLVLDRWIGPNPDDSLSKKLDHLQTRQLPLSSTPEARTALRRAGLPEPDLRAVTIKGYLFHPFDKIVQSPAPVDINHLRGLWLRLDDLPAWLRQRPDRRWQIMDQSQWLQPTLPSREPGREISAEGLLDAVRKRFDDRNRLVMLAPVTASADRRDAIDVPDGRRERLCIVPAGWPLGEKAGIDKN